ncbi:hypothetical protein C6499_20350 [Candidatus Poribacteria bacterium]|nr:MAG: hypothetical protein C6499_20350 [Candidatus Poribacteria bacterium]
MEVYRVSMTKYPNREALRKAHDIYRDAMNEFIFQYLEKKVEDETVDDLIMRVLNREQQRIVDIKGISVIFRNKECWNDFFSQQFGYDRLLGRHEYDIRSVTSLIVMGRNKVSHPGSRDLDFEYTRTHLFLIAEVLGEIGKTQAKHEVEEVCDELFSYDTDERIADMTKQRDAAKAEVTELKKQVKTKSDRLEEVEAEWLASEERFETVSTQLKVAVAGKTVAEERLSDISNRFEEAEVENAELKKCLSETENRLRTVESERDEHIKTLTEQPRTVEAEKTILEERPKNSPKQPEIKEWRSKIWKQLCDYAAQKDTPVRFHKPGSAHYLNVSRSLIALTGFKMQVWLGRDNREIAIRLYMSKQNFYILEKQRKEIEQEFCEPLEWEKLPQRSDSRISVRKDIIDPTDESGWQNQHEWVILKLEKFHKKFNEVFLPRIQERNTSDSLSEDEEYLPLNPPTPNSVTFHGTNFTKRLNEYHVAGDDISQGFWHYWHSQGREGKQEMRDAGWSVERVDGDWEVTISPVDFQAWIEDEVTELSGLLNSSQNEEPATRSSRSFDGRTVLPTSKEMEQPALKVLADEKAHRRVKIIDYLTEYFSLTDDERSYLSKTGQAEKHLMSKGLIERTRTGYYRITAYGLEVVNDVPF